MNKEQNLIASHQERLARKSEKEHRILRFLRHQVWSTAEILGEVAGIKSRQSVHHALSRMESSGLIIRHHIQSIGGKKTVWGITTHGQLWSFDPATDEGPFSNYFEPSKLAETTAHHHLGIQRIRLAAEQVGWSNWIDGNRLKASDKDGKRPDGLITRPDGCRVAIEFERRFKTIQRYESVLSAYLQALKRGEMDLVVWVCPDEHMEVRLQRLFSGIKRINVKGQSVSFEFEKYRDKLLFTSLATWPNL